MKKQLLVISLTAVITATVQAQVGTTIVVTNIVRDLFPANYNFSIHPIEKPFEPKTFLGKFVTEFGRSDSFINHLGNPSTFTWAEEFQMRPNEYNDRVIDAGHRSFEESATYGLRDAAVSYFPVEQYESYWEDTGSWLLHGTFGNTAEEQSSAVGATPTASDYSWWRTDGKPDGGIRPFNSSPYAYWHMGVGHCGGLPFATISGRWHYNVRRGSEHMDFETIFAMPHKLGLQVGASFDPLNADGNEGALTSIRLQHIDDTIFKTWSIGLMQNHHTIFVVQYSYIPPKW